jgi:uncharacterized protein YihD (DUF1040 family)
MRNEKRIPVVIEALQAAWTKSPDLRLGQLIVNLVGAGNPCPAIFYVEDDVLLARLHAVQSTGSSDDGK